MRPTPKNIAQMAKFRPIWSHWPEIMINQKSDMTGLEWSFNNIPSPYTGTYKNVLICVHYYELKNFIEKLGIHFTAQAQSFFCLLREEVLFIFITHVVLFVSSKQEKKVFT
jgi:hypothetical protein